MLPVPRPGCHVTNQVLSLPCAWCCFCCCYSTSGQMSPAAQTDGKLHLSQGGSCGSMGFSRSGISFHCIIFCLYEFPHKTKQVPKRPLSALQDQRTSVSPKCSSVLSFLCPLSSLSSPSPVCGVPLAMPQLQQSWDKERMGAARREAWKAQVPGQLWTGRLS